MFYCRFAATITEKHYLIWFSDKGCVRAAAKLEIDFYFAHRITTVLPSGNSVCFFFWINFHCRGPTFSISFENFNLMEVQTWLITKDRTEEVKSIQELLEEIDDEQLYEILKETDKLTVEILLYKM